MQMFHQYLGLEGLRSHGAVTQYYQHELSKAKINSWNILYEQFVRLNDDHSFILLPVVSLLS